MECIRVNVYFVAFSSFFSWCFLKPLLRVKGLTSRVCPSCKLVWSMLWRTHVNSPIAVSFYNVLHFPLAWYIIIFYRLRFLYSEYSHYSHGLTISRKELDHSDYNYLSLTPLKNCSTETVITSARQYLFDISLSSPLIPGNHCVSRLVYKWSTHTVQAKLMISR